jgi:RNA recognition motif-containing protein
MKIIVLNLHRDTTKEKLRDLFKFYGQVESVQLVMDKEKGTSKGFGFVEMPDEIEATAAIAALHGKKVGGNKIRVKVSDQTK